MKCEPVLITASSDGTISIWNTKQTTWTEDEIEEPKGEYTVNRLGLSLDKLKLVAACSDSLRLFDLKTTKNLFHLRKQTEEKSNVISLGFDI